MYYVWQRRLPRSLTLPGGAGEVEILDPGVRNRDAGPDFFNAKVRWGGTVWAGNVEMHVHASDWHRHGHDGDPAYANVILHVILYADAAVVMPDGRTLPQAIMTIPDGVMDRYRSLLQGGVDCFSAVTCTGRLGLVPRLVVDDWMTALVHERMWQKVNRVRDLVERGGDSWQEAFYVILTRSLGTGTNGDACERLARSLPYAYLQKHIDNPIQVEALLFGQAGFLDGERPDSEIYYNMLRQEYLFLRAKFSLRPLPVGVWKMARLRPPAFPHVRLAALAALLTSRRDFFSALLDATSLTEISRLFSVRMTGFWASHYTFSTPTPVAPVAAPPAASSRSLGVATLQSLVINAAVPMLTAYAQWRQDEQAAGRALAFLEGIPAEANRCVAACAAAGFPARNAFDTQALIQLHRNYCELHKCIRCRVGVWLMAH